LFFDKERTGTVVTGKRADLVLLDGNPLRDISNTTKIAGAMVGGRWMSKAEIDRQLEQSRPEPVTARR
jgi:imidazolonepropionase-like amidohydrolase